jgi:lipooligosaccharide transport system ATP-binding protein
MPHCVIQARDLRKSYGELEVVKGIQFDVYQGECFGVLGPNGAGKTTTIKMVICFSPIGGGELHIFGQDVRTGARAIKARLGVVPQEDDLDPDLSVLENLVVFGRYFDIPKAEALRRATELITFMQLESKVNDKIKHLSGGLKRRLTIARALMNKPEMLILDEPTTGLDPQARLTIWNKLRSLKQAGTGMLLTTHYMDEAARLCDRILVIDHGKILDTGTPVELIQRHVGDEVLEFRSETGDQPAGLAARIEATGVHVEVSGDTLFAFLKAGQADAVLHAGGPVKPFLRRQANLEDVFLRLTGRELRE